MRSALIRIFNDYLLESQHTFKDNELAQFIRHGGPDEIQETAVISEKQYLIKGSAGQGIWAEIPWICIFDRQISTTAQEGYYIVYLFRSDISGVYLSLNMGWTQFESKYETLQEAQGRISETASTC